MIVVLCFNFTHKLLKKLLKLLCSYSIKVSSYYLMYTIIILCYAALGRTYVGFNYVVSKSLTHLQTKNTN